MATGKKAAAENASENMVMFNREAYETVLDMQMSLMETASRFAKEVSEFAMHRAQVNVGDFARLAEVKSPPELMQMQLEHMRTMFEDYSSETSRLMSLAGATFGESSKAVRSSFVTEDELKKAG